MSNGSKERDKVAAIVGSCIKFLFFLRRTGEELIERIELNIIFI
jgi:hypothetical protein